uniref:Metalloprotease TIKI homolog n=1 Tax=Meloidogyne hapla TaxID=6305 RepID=A0A1I8BXR5_MELHA
MSDLLLVVKIIFFLIFLLASGIHSVPVPFKDLSNEYLKENVDCNNNVFNYFWTLSENGKDSSVSYIFGTLKGLTIKEINNSLPKELWKELNNSNIILLESNYNAKKADWADCFNKLKEKEIPIGKKLEEKLQNYYNNYQRFGLLKYFNWKDLPAQWLFQGLIDLRSELEKRTKTLNNELNNKLITKEIEERGIKYQKIIIHLTNLTDDLCDYYPSLASDGILMEFVLDKLLKEIEEIINKNKKIIGSWQRAINKYKCGEFERTDDLIGEENILKEFFDQVDLDNFRKTTNLLNKDLSQHRHRIATKIVKNLEENPGKKLFVVVGAGHLVGDDSLIKILAEKGFQLKQYSPSENLSEFIQDSPINNFIEEDYPQQSTNENNDFIQKTTTIKINQQNNLTKIPNIVFATALQGNPPFYENRSVREEKNREKEENKNSTFLVLKEDKNLINKLNEEKIIELNNYNLINTTEEYNNNNFTFIPYIYNKKSSSFWTYFTFILALFIIIVFVCWYIYNKHSGTSVNLKPPNLPFIGGKNNNCCQQSNISVAKGLPELKTNTKQQTPTISPPFIQNQPNNEQQQNIFPLNTSPPKLTTFSEISNKTGETSFICNEEEKIINNWENQQNYQNNENINKNEQTLLNQNTTTPLDAGQYRSTSSLTLSISPKTQLNQSRMEIVDQIQKLPQEPSKAPPPPLSQQLSTLPTIPEAKRLAPPPPIVQSSDCVIKHKKLASLDEREEKIGENLVNF